MYWTKILYEFYSSSHIFIFICNNCCDSFYTLHSMTPFSPSFLHGLLLNNLNDIHGKPVVTLTARLPKCVRICSRVLCVLSGGLSTTIIIPMVIYLAYGSTANF